MPLIETADDRAQSISRIKMVVLGESGAGKTTLAKTIERPLVLDCESGMLALEGSGIDSINVPKQALDLDRHPFEMLEDLVCVLAGPSPNVTDANDPYSRAHHVQAVERIGTRAELFDDYETIFIDSLTEISRFAFSAAKAHPKAFNDKGKPDTRGAYGLLGQWMVGADGLLNRLKHVRDKNIVIVGIMEPRAAEDGGGWTPQVEGSKTGKELQGIFDVVASLANIPHPTTSEPTRALLCGPNPYGYPGKDRSGQLDMIEPPDLGYLLSKIRGDRKRDLITTIPDGMLDAPAAPQSPANW